MIANQRLFVDRLFDNLQMAQLDDWLKVKTRSIVAAGGKRLLELYSFDLGSLLGAMYPNYAWEFADKDLSLIEHQRLLIEVIFDRLQLKKVDDWLNVSNRAMMLNGGRKLMQFYANDWMKLLTTLYPQHKWDFNALKLKMDRCSVQSSNEFNKSKLSSLKLKFSIEQKKDWYRLPLKVDQINVYRALKLIYPLERWSMWHFKSRTKKMSQRRLFIQLQKHFNTSIVFENYRHAKLVFDVIAMEFDVFIPSHNIAFEYQGGTSL